MPIWPGRIVKLSKDTDLLELLIVQTTVCNLNQNDGTLPNMYAHCLHHILKSVELCLPSPQFRCEPGSTQGSQNVFPSFSYVVGTLHEYLFVMQIILAATM